MDNRPNITLYSTPLVSTWVFDETHRILFDVGDGLAAYLEQKVAKVQLAALTHSHRDHIGGLMQFMNLRGASGDLSCIYPSGSGAIRAYAQFLASFDRGSTGKVNWFEMNDQDEWQLPDDRLLIKTFRNRHVDENLTDQLRSVGYNLIRRVDKLRKEYQELSQAELDAIRQIEGKESMLEKQDKIIFSISGDTSPLEPSTFQDCDYLLHECTFLDEEDGVEFNAGEHGHSVLGDVLKTAIQANVKHLGLYHISKRYEKVEMKEKIVILCEKLAVPFPVSAAYPGRVIEDFFSTTIWSGAGTMEVQNET